MAGGQTRPVHRVTEASQRRVRLLPPEVAGQIAAGEVVERPASVVKELVENALDAAARRIVVELEGAGSGLIAVVDDGEGMSAEDAVCAFSRHATSKVATLDDLQRITTLGFRGEALASIAAVSCTTLVTRREGESGATEVRVEHGRILETRAAGAPPGTRVEVADLFGNTPARRKFLKAPATEVAHVNELVTRMALAFPNVGFILRHAGRTLIELAGVEDPFERVRQVFGDERAHAMSSVLSRGSAGCVYGWLSDAHLTFPTPRQIYTYVNRRYVRDKLVSHALVAGYSTLLMHGRYPAAVLFLDVPPEEVDVNVHPAKSEVRFRRGGAVHELISRGVQTRLREQGQVHLAPTFAAQPGAFPGGAPPGRISTLRLADWPGTQGVSSGGAAFGAGQFETFQRHAVAVPFELSSFPVPPAPPQTNPRDPTGFFSSLRVVGQVFEGYLVCQQQNNLVLIDQHAAHERVTFENLRTAYGRGSVPSQQLLVPAVVEVGPREAALLHERLGELEALGFEVEPFGGTSFSIRSVPALLSDCDPAGLLRDVAEELVEVGRSRRLADAAESVLARLACHSAVRVGQSLDGQQIRALLAAMDRVDFASNCPHGRPAYIRFSRADLERWFKRT